MADQDNFVIDNFNYADEKVIGWDGQGGATPDVPPGEYRFECVNLTVKDTNAKDGRNLVATWRVVDGDYTGQEITQWYLFQGKNFKTGHARRIAQVFRDALGVPMSETGAWETRSAIGKQMWATVSHEASVRPGKYDPATGTTGAPKEFVNANLSCERACDDTAEAPPPPAPSAPPPKPPAGPPPNGAARAGGARTQTPPAPPPRR